MNPTTPLRLLLCGLLLALPSCSKDKDAAKKEAPSEVAPTQPAEPPEAAPEEPEAAVDYITVEARHAKPKPTDPILVTFEAFEIKEANFDPANLEGATARVVIDVASLKTDKAGRDKHLREPDYLDTEKFSIATVDVSGVKRLESNTYSANLLVDLHGQQNTWQVDFIVADSTESSVTIEMQHTFERRSFGIGAEDASPAQDILARARLTFRK